MVWWRVWVLFRARRRGGAAHDQLGAEALVVDLHPAAVVVELGDQQARGLARDVGGRLARGGEGRPRLPGERAVFEAGDGQVVRYVHAGGARRGQYAGGDFVVGAEDGGRPLLQRKQAPRPAEAVVERILAFHDERLVAGDVVVGECVDVALVAIDAGAEFLLAPEKA